MIIGPFLTVPEPGIPVESAWAQQLTQTVADRIPTAWTAVAFAGAWVNFDVARPTKYRKVGDAVEVRGLIKSGAIGTAAFTLPAGFRPVYEEVYACASNGALGLISVTAAGAVTPLAPSSNVYVYTVFRFSTVG